MNEGRKDLLKIPDSVALKHAIDYQKTLELKLDVAEQENKRLQKKLEAQNKKYNLLKSIVMDKLPTHVFNQLQNELSIKLNKL